MMPVERRNRERQNHYRWMRLLLLVDSLVTRNPCSREKIDQCEDIENKHRTHLVELGESFRFFFENFLRIIIIIEDEITWETLQVLLCLLSRKERIQCRDGDQRIVVTAKSMIATGAFSPPYVPNDFPALPKDCWVPKRENKARWRRSIRSSLSIWSDQFSMSRV